jgi:hypothetical protein
MSAFTRGLGRSFPAFTEFLKLLLRLLSSLLPFQRSLIRAIRNRFHRPERRGCCADIPPTAYKRADPMLYSQYWLLKQGLSVTWDNPDIQLYDMNGILVSPWELATDRDYKVVVRVWNNSYDGPAAGLPVYLSFLSFGVGTKSSSVGKEFIDLGVKGSLHCPAFATFTWHTPIQEGHYCLRALLVWSDDANPDNNLGQKNTQVGKAHSPAKFSFEVNNQATVRRQFDLEADMYQLPQLPPCSEEVPKMDARRQRQMSRLAESKARWESALHSQGYGLFPVNEEWRITIEPNHFLLGPAQSQSVEVNVEPTGGTFTGSETFNIHAFASPPGGPRLPAGGVTLYVKGE